MGAHGRDEIFEEWDREYNNYSPSYSSWSASLVNYEPSTMQPDSREFTNPSILPQTDLALYTPHFTMLPAPDPHTSNKSHGGSEGAASELWLLSSQGVGAHDHPTTPRNAVFNVDELAAATVAPESERLSSSAAQPHSQSCGYENAAQPIPTPYKTARNGGSSDRHEIHRVESGSVVAEPRKKRLSFAAHTKVKGLLSRWRRRTCA